MEFGNDMELGENYNGWQRQIGSSQIDAIRFSVDDMREQRAQIVIRFDGKNLSGSKLPYLSPLTLPSPPLFPLRGRGGEGSGTGNLFSDES